MEAAAGCKAGVGADSADGATDALDELTLEETGMGSDVDAVGCNKLSADVAALAGDDADEDVCWPTFASEGDDVADAAAVFP